MPIVLRLMASSVVKGLLLKVAVWMTAVIVSSLELHFGKLMT